MLGNLNVRNDLQETTAVKGRIPHTVQYYPCVVCVCGAYVYSGCLGNYDLGKIRSYDRILTIKWHLDEL